jgi:hypothetical protein
MHAVQLRAGLLRVVRVAPKDLIWDDGSGLSCKDPGVNLCWWRKLTACEQEDSHCSASVAGAQFWISVK